MDALQLLIDQETAKLAVLKKEVSAREARIATLRSLQKSSASELDALLSEQVTTVQPENSAQKHDVMAASKIGIQWPMPKPDTDAETTPSPASETQEDKKTLRKRGELKAAILTVMSGQGPMHITDIKGDLLKHDVEISQDRLRTELWKMRHSNLVESPSTGVFQIPEKGETPGNSAGGNQQAGGFELQPSPSDGTH